MKWWLLPMLLWLCWGVALGQDDLQSRKLQAKDFIVHTRYGDALTVLRGLRGPAAKDQEFRLLMAICHYQLNGLDEAEAILTELTQNEKSSLPESWLFLAKVYHARHQFDLAARSYKVYLRGISSNHGGRSMVAEDLRRCSNGLQIQYRESQAFVENLGPQINTDGDEFGAVFSPNYENRLYFSSRRPGSIGGLRNARGETDERYGQYYSDIYVAQSENGTWGQVQPLHYLLNSPRHEVLFDFNSDGSVMYYYQGNNWYGGSVIVDTFRQAEERVLSSDPFTGPVEPTAERASPHFVNAGMVIFPSRRDGGFGGMDLYVSVMRNGSWSEPQNLGSDINTPFDETTPFLALDGRTLYFSSNASDRSIGGFDVLRATYLPKLQRWTAPENLGLPINSAGDDTHFRLARDGFSAFLSSSRKDGLGGRDLYSVYFSEYREEQEPPQDVAATFLHTETGRELSRQFPEPAPAAQPALADRITYRSQSELLAGQNMPLIDDLAGQLRRGDGARLVITVLCGGNDHLSEVLYEAVQSAAPVAEYLTKKGGAAPQISLNARLDAGVGGGSKTIVFRVVPGGVLASRGAPGSPVRPEEAPLVYGLQIALLGGVFTGTFMDGLPESWVEKDARQPVYYYLAGRYKTFAEAERGLQTLASKGITGTVIPYIAGFRSSPADAALQVERLPDLQNYLRKYGKR